jgi:electron-transferring-flavoprotein dehydrogenase
VWQVPEENLKPGFIQHTIGWPLQDSLMSKTFGGTFLYHMKPNLILLGMVVGLDYANPYLNPYKEFQRWKHHPEVAGQLAGGECVSYGARCLNEGGYHAIPKLTFPGGVLVGCSAGFLNSIKIKGTHTAMKSGMVAAEAIHAGLTGAGAVPVAESGEIDPAEAAIEATDYETNIYKSWVIDELKVKIVYIVIQYII